MRRLALVGVIIAPLVALLLGCAPKPIPVTAEPVELTEAGADALSAALDERKGKVVLVDFWATWCPPCRKRFPDFVATHNKYKGHGLVCVSVSMDKLWPRGKYSKSSVLDVLREEGADFRNFVAMDDEQKIRTRFGLEDSIPYMALFNKAGKKVWDKLEKQLSESDLDKLIESELAK